MTTPNGPAWGEAWLVALVDEVGFDSSRLARGRGPERRGLVENIELSPGLVRADVGGGGLPEATQLGVSRLSDDRWDKLLDAVAARPSDSAAVLSGDVPDELAQAALPGSGDISPGCSCGSWDELCPHSAALCHRVAGLVDDDPFALLLLRGRRRDQILAVLRARRAATRGVAAATTAEHPRGLDPGVSGAGAYRRTPTPITQSARLPSRPGRMPDINAVPPAGSGVERSELSELVADAARRAFEMFGGDADSEIQLDVEADIARRAHSGDASAISSHTNIPEAELTTAAIAWGWGRAAGLKISSDRWDPRPDQVAPAVSALGTGAKARRNWVSRGRTQLRLDSAGVWWRFEADDNLGWVLASEGASDPTELVEHTEP
ncbi:MAG: hypothetical protein GY708_12555 [Actinomycetia bacterium]|nr:hypothetical protein [Actinomycetes bacterium]MCP4957760.1 hypothetical protein [Actinomycetes bacterium]